MYELQRLMNRLVRHHRTTLGHRHIADAAREPQWPCKIFSGIQPSGELHLGNYLGAVRKWTELQNQNKDVTCCIVDMHSVTLPHEAAILRENIFKLTATMLACGISPSKSTIFVQSAVKEHSEMYWLLGTLCTMARLEHLPQYKDRAQQLREIPLGLFVYPILQAADIMLYKATQVPVGEDQVQHIQLTQNLARVFNSRFGTTFPVCHAIVDDENVSRIRSLSDPTKKMSKSDVDSKSAIYLTDEPDVVVEKLQNATTDLSSDVSYDMVGRPGLSNLIAIHSDITGQPIKQIVNDAKSLGTGKYKLRLAEVINEHFQPIRASIKDYLRDRNELIHLLDLGAEKARNIAITTVDEVKRKMGLGAPNSPMLYLHKLKPVSKKVNVAAPQPALTKPTKPSVNEIQSLPKLEPVVRPREFQQRLRVEKEMKTCNVVFPEKSITVVEHIAAPSKKDENERVEKATPVKPLILKTTSAIPSKNTQSDMSNQRSRSLGNKLVTTTTTLIQLDLKSVPQKSTMTKTTLPVPWSGAKSNSSDSKISGNSGTTEKKVKVGIATHTQKA